MTNLVKGYKEIHVFVEHPVHEPLKLLVKDFEPLVARQLGSEPKGVDVKALEVFVGDQQNEDVVYCVSNDSLCLRPSKAPIVDDQVEESSEAEGSDLEDELEMQSINIGQMGGGVMNSNYKNEELLSLNESSSSSEHGDDSSDDDIPIIEVDNSIREQIPNL
nr:hypothetical protein CFP56_77988 [Quercus suber]